MRFDIYGRFEIEVTREGGAWVAYRIEPGKRIGMPDLALPAALAEHEIAVFPDDLYHEMSKSGQTICAL